jgi:hypothetical protein
MSSLLVFVRVYRLEIQLVMLAFSTPLVNCRPSIFSLTSPTPHTLSQSKSTKCGCGGGGGVLFCVVYHIVQEFNTLFLTIFITYKIAIPPQTKTPVMTTFRDWCRYSSFVHGQEEKNKRRFRGYRERILKIRKGGGDQNPIPPHFIRV